MTSRTSIAAFALIAASAQAEEFLYTPPIPPAYISRSSPDVPADGTLRCSILSLAGRPLVVSIHFFRAVSFDPGLAGSQPAQLAASYERFTLAPGATFYAPAFYQSQCSEAMVCPPVVVDTKSSYCRFTIHGDGRAKEVRGSAALWIRDQLITVVPAQ